MWMCVICVFFSQTIHLKWRWNTRLILIFFFRVHWNTKLDVAAAMKNKSVTMRATQEAKHSAVRHRQPRERLSARLFQRHIEDLVEEMKECWSGRKSQIWNGGTVTRTQQEMMTLFPEIVTPLSFSAPFPKHIKGMFQCVVGFSVCLFALQSLFLRQLQEKCGEWCKK